MHHQAEDDPLDVLPSRQGRKLCVRHKQMANQDVNQKLQRSLDNLPTSERSAITHLWSTFSNAQHAKRKIILEGILTMCCFSQLSHLSDSLNQIIRIDPFSLLPREVNLRILGYLDAISLGRAAQVAKSWKALADDDLLWRRMCGQHIDRKCEKCGWGLPLLERRRLKGELNEGSPAVAVSVGGHGEGHEHDHEHGHGPRMVLSREEALGVKDKDKEGQASGSGSSGAANGHAHAHAHAHAHHTQRGGQTVCDLAAPNLLKRNFEGEQSAAKKQRTESDAGSDGSAQSGRVDKGKGKQLEPAADSSLSREVRLTRPWKSVYCERLVVERNWRKGRCKTTTLRGHEDGVMCLQYHSALAYPSHPVLMTGSYDKTVRIWNLDTGECLRVLRGHTRAVRALQFDQRLLFTGSMDGTVRMWNWRAGECLRVLEGHTDGVVTLAYNGSLLASGSADSTINVWNFRTGNKFTLRGHDDSVNCVVLWDGRTSPGDLDPTQMPSFTGAGAGRRSASPHKPSGSPSVSTTSYDDQTGEANGSAGAKAGTNAGMMLFSASDDETVKLWNLETQECVRTFRGHKAQVQSLKVLMVDMTEDEIKARRRMRSATPPEGGVMGSATAAAFALAGGVPPASASGSAGSGSAWQSAAQAPLRPPGTLENVLVDVPEGFDPHALRAAPRGRALEPRVYVHTPDGEVDRQLAAGGLDGRGRQVDEECEDAGGEQRKRAVLVTASLDGTVKVWDVETGMESGTLFGHIEGVWGVDGDALRIASASHDRTVKVWDRDSSKCVQTLVGHRGAVTTLQLSDDMIVSGSDDGDVMVWSFAPGATAGVVSSVLSAPAGTALGVGVTAAEQGAAAAAEEVEKAVVAAAVSAAQ